MDSMVGSSREKSWPSEVEHAAWQGELTRRYCVSFLLGKFSCSSCSLCSAFFPDGRGGV